MCNSHGRASGGLLATNVLVSGSHVLERPSAHGERHRLAAATGPTDQTGSGSPGAGIKEVWLPVWAQGFWSLLLHKHAPRAYRSHSFLTLLQAACPVFLLGEHQKSWKTLGSVTVRACFRQQVPHSWDRKLPEGLGRTEALADVTWYQGEPPLAATGRPRTARGTIQDQAATPPPGPPLDRGPWDQRRGRGSFSSVPPWHWEGPGTEGAEIKGSGERATQTGPESQLCHEPAYVTPGSLLQLSLHFLPQKRKTEWVLSSVLKHLIHSRALKSGSLLHQIHFKDESCLGCTRQGEIEKKFKIVIFHRSKWATKVLSIALHEVNTNNLYLFKAVFF